MTVEPALLAVIMPLLLISAILLFVLLHDLGVSPKSLSLYVLLPLMVTFVLFRYGFLTVILQVYFPLLTTAVIVTFPAFFAVTFPLLLTETIFLFELDHFTFASVPLNFKLILFPTYIVAFVLFNFILVFALTPTLNTHIKTSAISADTAVLNLFLLFDFIFILSPFLPCHSGQII